MTNGLESQASPQPHVLPRIFLAWSRPAFKFTGAQLLALVSC